MAAVTPQTIPWITPVRGSSDGVNDRHETTTAPQKPGTVRLCHCPRRPVSGRGPGSGAPPRVCGGTATPVVPASAFSDMLGLLCPGAAQPPKLAARAFTLVFLHHTGTAATLEEGRMGCT